MELLDLQLGFRPVRSILMDLQHLKVLMDLLVHLDLMELKDLDH